MNLRNKKRIILHIFLYRASILLTARCSDKNLELLLSDRQIPESLLEELVRFLSPGMSHYLKVKKEISQKVASKTPVLTNGRQEHSTLIVSISQSQLNNAVKFLQRKIKSLNNFRLKRVDVHLKLINWIKLLN